MNRLTSSALDIKIKKYEWICGVLIFSAIMSVAETFAQELPSQGGQKKEYLPVLRVEATRSNKRIIDIPSAISRTSQREILNGNPQLTLDEGLTLTPGVFFQNQFNFAQDLRISIRGFGARSSFGVRGVKVLLDGISQTLPDGQTQLDSIDPGMIESIEILRGPFSSLYGNASGGVISINTQEGSELGKKSTLRLELGQFGLEKYQFKMGGIYGPLNYHIYTSNLKSDGYRDHSDTSSSLIHGKFSWATSSKSDWTFIISHFYSPRAEDPGGLTGAQKESNPQGASTRNILFDAGERVKNTNFGLIYRKKLKTHHKFLLTANFGHRFFKNKLPFISGGSVEFERLTPGFGVRSVFDTKLLDRPSRLITGADFAFQRDDRKRFDNNNGIQGDKTLDRLETVCSIGPYFRMEWKWAPHLELIGGVRYDRVHFDLGDAFLEDGNQSDSQTLAEWSGTLGAIFHWNEFIHFYANVATVFETPTTTELANDPSGGSGFNSNLNSQKSVNYEIGLKSIKTGVTELDLALFFIQSRDELIPFELVAWPGRTFYKNAGESLRIGLEAIAVYQPLEWIKTSLSYTYADFKFIEFDYNGVNQSGNFIPGIPEHQLTIALDAYGQSGWFARGEIQNASAFFVNNENTVKNDAYTKSRFSIGKTGNFGMFRWSIFFGLNNIFDDKYQANTRINASSDRFFEPAPPINAYGGMSLVYDH